MSNSYGGGYGGYNAGYGQGQQGAGGSRYRQPLFARQDGQQVQVMVDRQDADLDTEIEALRSGVGRLKHLGKAIHEESQLQNALLSQLEEGFEKAKLALSSAQRRLGRAMVQVKSHHMLALVAFALLVIFAIWLFKKIYWLL